MRLIVALIAFASIAAHADQPPRPELPCFQVPPEIREAWHLKPTDCLHVIPVVRACDVTPPDVAKQLGLKLQCPNWPKKAP